MMKTGAHIALCFELKKVAPIRMLLGSEKRKLYACE